MSDTEALLWPALAFALLGGFASLGFAAALLWLS